MRNIDVSVIVACYNPDIVKLKKTINSILNQVGVSYEIIIADDGSEFEYKSEIEKWFKENQVKNYKLSFLPENQGTIKNIYFALSYCSGEYVKTISPGDLLISEHIICECCLFGFI